MKYSATTNGFYLPEVHGVNIPADAVDITADEHLHLLDGQSAGLRIVADTNGFPILQARPPKTLSEAKADKIAQIEAARDASTEADVSALGTIWQADERSQKLLTAAILIAQAGLPLPAVWRDSFNKDLPITSISQLIAIAGAMAEQTQAAYTKSWQMKALVNAATTAAELDAIKW